MGNPVFRDRVELLFTSWAPLCFSPLDFWSTYRVKLLSNNLPTRLPSASVMGSPWSVCVVAQFAPFLFHRLCGKICWLPCGQGHKTEGQMPPFNKEFCLPSWPRRDRSANVGVSETSPPMEPSLQPKLTPRSPEKPWHSGPLSPTGTKLEPKTGADSIPKFPSSQISDLVRPESSPCKLRGCGDVSK